MQFCSFCDAEAKYKIKNETEEGRKFETPVCGTCKDVYEAGQASPNAEIEAI